MRTGYAILLACAFLTGSAGRVRAEDAPAAAPAAAPPAGGSTVRTQSSGDAPGDEVTPPALPDDEDSPSLSNPDPYLRDPYDPGDSEDEPGPEETPELASPGVRAREMPARATEDPYATDPYDTDPYDTDDD